jgi:RNA polymerase sigma factor (sigma-70 family)
MVKAERKPQPPQAAACGGDSGEHDLLDGLKRGDEFAARDFYDRYSHRVYRFIFQALGGPPADAEDLMQETFMALADALPFFHGDCSLFTFACAIARRKVASFIRTRSRRVKLDAASLAPIEAAADDIRSSLDATAALAALTPQYREVLHLKYVEELTVAEIASVLEITQHAVESRLARARRALAIQLGVTK